MARTLCTFNVNSVRARLELLRRWLTQKRQVDILALQEIKCETDRFPYEAFEAMGYHAAVHGQKRLHGVAICSRQPFDEVTTRFDDPFLDRESRLIEARIGKTLYLNVYVPRGAPEGEEAHAFKMAFYDALTAHVKKRLAAWDRVVLLGDFNVARNALDLHDPALFEGEVGYLPSERERFARLLETGLHDCFRRLHPQTRAFTWWDYRTAAIWRDEGMRLDYILASSACCERLESIEVDLWPRRRRTPTPSDHAPVVARFGAPQ